MGKKKLAKTALSAALVGSMILGNAASVYAWTTSDEVSDREKASGSDFAGGSRRRNGTAGKQWNTSGKERCESRCLRRQEHWQRSKEEPVPVM